MKSLRKLGFNLVLLGMIASGKETQANALKKKYPLKFIEPGVFSRKLLKVKGKNGDIARRTVGKGKPLPTIMLQRFLKKEIKNIPKDKDFVFLGGRLKPEAQLFRKIMENQGKRFLVFYITLPDKEVYRRSLLRKKGKMKKIYKVLDTPKIIKARIDYHKKQVSKTVKYYRKLGLMRIINGNQPILKVTKDILKEIEKFGREN